MCKATVTSPLGGVTGQVSFSSDGKGTFGDIGCNDNRDNGNGGSLVCNVKYTPSAIGTKTMTAAYPGDAHHSASSGTLQFSVNDRGGEGNIGGPGTALASASSIAFPGLLAATFSTLPGRPSTSLNSRYSSTLGRLLLRGAKNFSYAMSVRIGLFKTGISPSATPNISRS